jgi:L-ascorbate metabolism protein UlaG (beta-lactamase superfamily)
MSKLMRSLGFALLFAAVILSLGVALVPAFLDRIYYRGPASAHFDGAHFFNPDGEDTERLPSGGSNRGTFLLRQATGNDGRPAWPAHVAAAAAAPPARVAGAQMRVTWIGHATMLVQTQGLNILTDPTWSDTAGPFGLGPRRVAPPALPLARLPKIDLVLLSHNHYDHFDRATLARLWRRDRPLIVTSLGNDAILRDDGVAAVALDWGQRRAVRGDVAVIVTRNHHWGSRWFTDRNRALWSSFVVTLPGGNLFFAGDTGFGDGGWPIEARRFGPIRLALLPIGAFRFTPGQMRTAAHLGPEEAVEVARRLGAAHALALHWGTFRLSYEARETPPALLRVALRCAGLPATGWFDAPPIGATVTIAAMRPAPAGRARDPGCTARNGTACR